MGYSRRLSTLTSRLHLLVKIQDGLPDSWPCERGDEKATAFRIREALRIAATIGAITYPKLATAQATFKIVEGDGEVRAVPKDMPKNEVSSSLGVPTAPQFAEVFDVMELIAVSATATLPVTYNVAALPKSDILNFMRVLKRKHNHLLFLAENRLTIHPHDPELEPLALTESELSE